MRMMEEKLVVEMIVGRREESHLWHRLLLSDLEVIAASLEKYIIELHSSECAWLEALGYSQNGAHLLDSDQRNHPPVVVYHLRKKLRSISDEEPQSFSEARSELETSLLPALFAALHREVGSLPPTH